MTTALDWQSAFLSHQGAVRSVNEDAFLEAPEVGLWAVADGMGGHEAGQLASRVVVDTLASVPGSENPTRLVEAVQGRLALANQRLRKLSLLRFGGRIIGSTVAVLIAFPPSATCLWAGDSRIYLCRGERLRQLTRDHSRREDMRREGSVSRTAPPGAPLANVITRAVGAEDDLVLEERPEPICPGDRILLCTDGLNREVSDAELEAIVRCGSCNEAAHRLLALALERQASDNVTLGIVEAIATHGVT